jgi:VPDSG-CTERM motif
MKNRSKTVLAILATGLLSCTLFSQQARATLINGTINFSGFVTLSKNPAMMTSSLHFTGPAFTTLATGDYASIPSGTNAGSFTSFTFNDSSLAITSPATPFVEWSFVFGGITYQFLVDSPLTSGHVTLGPPLWSFAVSGTGTATATGFNDTLGVFTLSGTGTAAHLMFAGSFSAVGVAAVPDGGSAVALLGIALVAIEVLRRKQRIG